MANLKLIEECKTALEELNAFPHHTDRIDMDYEHHVYLWTLRNIYDEGMDYSELARAIIFQMNYWPSAEPYV